MPRDLRAYLHDIKEACQAIQEYTADKSYGDYATDGMLRSAVERQFIIIGEALLQAMRLLPDLRGEISGARRIINFRNVLVHGYALVEHETVWGVVSDSLPVLRQEVEVLLARDA